jgi:hypothetical protein
VDGAGLSAMCPPPAWHRPSLSLSIRAGLPLPGIESGALARTLCTRATPARRVYLPPLPRSPLFFYRWDLRPSSYKSFQKNISVFHNVSYFSKIFELSKTAYIIKMMKYYLIL